MMNNNGTRRIKGSLGDIPIYEEQLGTQLSLNQVMTMNRGFSKRQDDETQLIRVQCRLPETAVFTGESYCHQLNFKHEISKQWTDDFKDILAIQSAHEYMVAALRNRPFEAPANK